MPHSLGKTRILIALLSIAAIGVFSRFSWDLFVDSLGPGDPRLCACDKCLLHGDPWFRALVNSSPQPFLTNYSTSKDVFNWWKVNVNLSDKYSAFVSVLTLTGPMAKSAAFMGSLPYCSTILFFISSLSELETS